MTDNSLALAIALTGGIASGKSATAERFAQLGVAVFDADVVAHEVVAAGRPALQEIAAAFGFQVIAADGTLDRARMREMVFADARARRHLESILHPRIRAALLESVQACRAPYCVVAIPLLVECREDYRWVERVLITDVPVAMQVARLTRRPGINVDLANRILAAQATRMQRLALADDLIDNTAPLESLNSAVGRLHQRYLAMATQEHSQ